MSNYETFITLWRFMELSEKKRLMQQFIQKHGDIFSRDEFFEFLANKYQSDQVKFETVGGELINGEAA